MSNSLLRTDKEIAALYERHVKTVYRICFAYLKNSSDTEDVVQDTFIKLIQCRKEFRNVEHEKAWLIVTATNLCINQLRHWWRKRTSIEDYTDLSDDKSFFDIDETFKVIMSLPDKYKLAIYLYYYEGYTSIEIARFLKKKESTIRGYLYTGRKRLKLKLGGVIDD